MRLSEIELKDVIEITTGKNIGRINDVVINDKGEVEFFIIDTYKNSLFSKSDSLNVSFKDIYKIGDDCILIGK